MIIAEYCEKNWSSRTPSSSCRELWRQKLEFREVHQQNLTEMEELRKFQSSTFDTIARRKLIEDQDFQDAESVRSGNSHVTSRPVSVPPHPIPEGMLRHSFVSPRRREGPPSIWDTHGISGNVFCKSTCIIISSLSSRIESIECEKPLHTSTAEKSERPEQNRDLRCQSGPSAKDSVILS